MIEDTIINLRQRFAKKGIKLELEEGPNLKAFIEIINKQQWIESVTNEGSGELILYANNMNEAQVSIPRILNENKLALKKFSILEPTLEDIFMKVVNK